MRRSQAPVDAIPDSYIRDLKRRYSILSAYHGSTQLYAIRMPEVRTVYPRTLHGFRFVIVLFDCYYCVVSVLCYVCNGYLLPYSSHPEIA